MRTPPDPAMDHVIAALDRRALRAEFDRQGEFLALRDFLPAPLLEELLGALPSLRPSVHRNYIPRHKKGGSISRHDLDRLAPMYAALYRSRALKQFLEQLTGQSLSECPGDDPHTYALYYYTEAGDHIGWHYDTSYYRGARYTVLIGLVDRSTCRLEYELHRKEPGRVPEHHAVALEPGMLVVFNGDKLYHRITPLGEGEERIVLTLEYVTDARMHPLRRFVSNMKDAIAYFGLRQVFGKRA